MQFLLAIVISIYNNLCYSVFCFKYFTLPTQQLLDAPVLKDIMYYDIQAVYHFIQFWCI